MAEVKGEISSRRKQIEAELNDFFFNSPEVPKSFDAKLLTKGTMEEYGKKLRDNLLNESRPTLMGLTQTQNYIAGETYFDLLLTTDDLNVLVAIETDKRDRKQEFDIEKRRYAFAEVLLADVNALIFVLWIGEQNEGQKKSVTDWSAISSGHIASIHSSAAWALILSEEEIRIATPSVREGKSRNEAEDEREITLPEAAAHAASDAPATLATDELGFKAYVDTFTELFQSEQTEPPVTVAINSPWGVGKSSLGGMIRERLDDYVSAPGVIECKTLWFNAWDHDEAEKLTGAFIAELVRGVDRMRLLTSRLSRPLPWSLSQREAVGYWWLRWLVAAFVAGAVTIAGTYAWAFILDADVRSIWAALLTVTPIVGAAFILLPKFVPMAAKFVTSPGQRASRGEIARLRDEVQELLDDALKGPRRRRNRRLVIFIDDLERCRPPKSIDLLEAINQLLPRDNVIVVIMADMPAVAANADIKYEKIAKLYDPARGGAPIGERASHYGRLYLQKMVQLQFDLPTHRRHNRKTPSVDSSASVDNGGDPVNVHLAVSRSITAMMVRMVMTGDLKEGRFANLGLQSRNLMLRWLAGFFLLITEAFVVPLILLRQAISGDTRYSRREAEIWSERSPSPESGTWLKPVALIVGIGLAVAIFAPVTAPTVMNFYLTHILPHENLLPLGVSLLSLMLGMGIAYAITKYQADEVERERQAAAELVDVEGATDDDFEALILQSNVSEYTLASVRQGLAAKEFARADTVAELLGSAAVEKFLTLTPRGQLRLENRIRLLISILRERGILDRFSGQGSDILAKWVVLQERWPELAHAVARNPAVASLLQLESVAATTETLWDTPSPDGTSRVQDDFTIALADIAPEVVGDPDLLEFMRMEPGIGSLQNELVTFDAL